MEPARPLERFLQSTCRLHGCAASSETYLDYNSGLKASFWEQDLKHKLLNDCTKCTRDDSEAAVVGGCGTPGEKVVRGLDVPSSWPRTLPWNPSALMKIN